jgi:hypothetical protein
MPPLNPFERAVRPKMESDRTRFRAGEPAKQELVHITSVLDIRI